MIRPVSSVGEPTWDLDPDRWTPERSGSPGPGLGAGGGGRAADRRGPSERSRAGCQARLGREADTGRVWTGVAAVLTGRGAQGRPLRRGPPLAGQRAAACSCRCKDTPSGGPPSAHRLLSLPDYFYRAWSEFWARAPVWAAQDSRGCGLRASEIILASGDELMRPKPKRAGPCRGPGSGRHLCFKGTREVTQLPKVTQRAR